MCAHLDTLWPNDHSGAEIKRTVDEEFRVAALGEARDAAPAPGLPPRGDEGRGARAFRGLGRRARTHRRNADRLYFTRNSMWARPRLRTACGHPRALRVGAGLPRSG